MADQYRWFKVWTSILNDPDFAEMPVADIGRWVLLGATIAQCGQHGSLRVPRMSYLARLFRCYRDDGSLDQEEAVELVANFPHIILSDSPVHWDHGRGKRPISTGLVWRGGEVVEVRGGAQAKGGCGKSFEEWCRNSVDFFVTFENWSKYQIDTTARERGAKLRSKRRGEEIREYTTPPTPSQGDVAQPELSLKNPPPQPLPKRERHEPTQALEWNESWANAPWGSVPAFVALYNQRAPREWARCQTVGNGLQGKITAYLKQFPRRDWWEEVYRQADKSKLCQEYKGAGIAWMLQLGRNSRVENCAQIHDGQFTG